MNDKLSNKQKYRYVVIYGNDEETLGVIGAKNLNALTHVIASFSTEENKELNFRPYTKTQADKLGIIPDLICSYNLKGKCKQVPFLNVVGGG
jgi:hypothetical protein